MFWPECFTDSLVRSVGTHGALVVDLNPAGCALVAAAPEMAGVDAAFQVVHHQNYSPPQLKISRSAAIYVWGMAFQMVG